MKIYCIIWKDDYTEEKYDNIDEYSGRVESLENQGYENGQDFYVEIKYK